VVGYRRVSRLCRRNDAPPIRVAAALQSENLYGARAMKITLIFALVGALLGLIVASLVVPPALAWYTSPGGLPKGVQIQAVVQIPEVIRYATSHLIRGQAIGGAIGAALGVALGVFLGAPVRRRRPA